MILVGKQKLIDLMRKHSDCKKQLDAWIAVIEADQYEDSHDLRHRHQKASTIGDKNVVFNICRNAYRIWAKIDYQRGIVSVERAGTHKEYERWGIA